MLGPRGFGFELLADVGRLPGRLGNQVMVGAAVRVAGSGFHGRPFDEVDEALPIVGALFLARGLQLPEFGPLLFLALLDVRVGKRAPVIELLANRVLPFARRGALLVAQGVAGFGDLLLRAAEERLAVGKHLPCGCEVVFARQLDDLRGKLCALALGPPADGIRFPEMLDPALPELISYVAVGRL